MGDCVGHPIKKSMYKKSPFIPALAIALLLTAKTYSQKTDTSSAPDKTASSAADYSSLPPAKIVDKLQDQIITWQDEIIRGMEDQPVVQIIYRDMAGIALDNTSGVVKDQKMLDLLTKYGLGVSTKDGKKLNSPSAEADFLKVTPEIVPMIEVKDSATAAEKARIRALLDKGQTLVDKATLAKKWAARLEIAALDLLQLAKTDPGAQTLVDKYHIKQHPTSPVSASSPAPSTSPAP